MEEKYYNVVDYGIRISADDNTEYLQKLMNIVADKGGGTIYFPAGVYRFAGQVWAKSHVSIVGENKDKTVLKMTGNVTDQTRDIALFYHHYPADGDSIRKDPIVGCTYHDFTVEAGSVTTDRYRVGNKAFYFQNCYDCTWRDLKLIGTPATALGVDCLVDCFITRVTCKDCGRGWNPEAKYGGAAIGIGAGLYDEENVIVSDCIVEGAGHFGIFFEHQSLFTPSIYQAQPKGVIIHGNIVRNGKYHGIGARGMTNMKICSNLIYNNLGSGIYIDNQAMNLDISDNTILDNKDSGIHLHAGVFGEESGTTGNLDNVWVRNNLIKGDCEGIRITKEEGKEIRGFMEMGNVIMDH